MKKSLFLSQTVTEDEGGGEDQQEHSLCPELISGKGRKKKKVTAQTGVMEIEKGPVCVFFFLQITINMVK
jgi:hypothetical protein